MARAARKRCSTKEAPAVSGGGEASADPDVDSVLAVLTGEIFAYSELLLRERLADPPLGGEGGGGGDCIKSAMTGAEFEASIRCCCCCC